MASNNRLTICGITQQTDRKYFNSCMNVWTPDQLDVLEHGSAEDLGKILFHMLQPPEKGWKVESLYLIIHDKDEREVWDESLHSYVRELKPRHFHAVVKFWVDKRDRMIHSGTLVDIATAVGLEPQYIEKAPRGGHGYDNMLAYLIHFKYPEKYQYDPSEVFSIGCFHAGSPAWKPYPEIYAERRIDWEKGRAKVQKKQASESIDELEMKILTGEVTRNQVLLTDSLFEIYARNKRRCDDAFDIYADRKIAKTIQAMENGEFKLTVYYVTGKSHAGKSYFTDGLVKRIIEEAKDKLGQDWSICTCAATNPLDEYRGEEVLVMDDLRGLAMSASDWLKLLDPDRVNMGSARYHNRRIACRVVVINSERDVLDFFYYVKGAGGGERSEAMDQFFRRILARVVVYRVPDMPDTRRALVGHMQEVPAYQLPEPGDKIPQANLTLHHDFNDNQKDMNYDEALEHLADVVMKRNGA